MPRPKNPNAYGDPADIAAATKQAPRPLQSQHAGEPLLGLLERHEPTPPLQSDLMTLAEFATLVRRHPRTVRGWIRDGLIPVVQIGRAKFIHRDALDAMLFGIRSGDDSNNNSNYDPESEQVKASSTSFDTMNRTCVPEIPLSTPSFRKVY